jgi:hypothetical protein
MPRFTGAIFLGYLGLPYLAGVGSSRDPKARFTVSLIRPISWYMNQRKEILKEIQIRALALQESIKDLSESGNPSEWYSAGHEWLAMSELIYNRAGKLIEQIEGKANGQR